MYDWERDSSGPKVGRFRSEFKEESKWEEPKEKRKWRSRSWDKNHERSKSKDLGSSPD